MSDRSGIQMAASPDPSALSSCVSFGGFFTGFFLGRRSCSLAGKGEGPTKRSGRRK